MKQEMINKHIAALAEMTYLLRFARYLFHEYQQTKKESVKLRGEKLIEEYADFLGNFCKEINDHEIK